MMVLEHDVSDAAVISSIRDVVDLLAKQEYEAVFKLVGYTMAGITASASWIESDIKRYRSELYPGISEFVVSDWRAAQEGNPNPKQEVVRYKENSSGLFGAASFHLPLNGKWSDLSADFILVQLNSESRISLKLEEICS
ncbi:hypothetical protein [Roseibacillus persicicus]|uniref:Uncharacterized protein n=1 Tax=Roseibacillus persicicus TaxID=454148 RepID=A0A918U0Q2_9BACT|nr:hypothetical protein [Roseibacillus persicicus]GHC68371.1 hypothetical protein GCM10007100_40440 [Roseibacillus persicicus]